MSNIFRRVCDFYNDFEDQHASQPSVDKNHSKLKDSESVACHEEVNKLFKGKREMSKENFINKSDLIFTDISSELYREYVFAHNQINKEVIVRIDNPLFLHVSKSGGHRIYSGDGMSHYIPSGWIHLKWKARDGMANFVK